MSDRTDKTSNTPRTSGAVVGDGKRQPTPNHERSATTRARILNAAITCLYELGYHQTSTVVVAREAGLSRGTMLHHFPSRADLMIAVAQEVCVVRGDFHRRRLSKLKSRREQFLALIDVLFEANLSPTGVARLELMMGTRSDPDVAEQFDEMNAALDRRHKKNIWGLAKGLGITRAEDRPKVDAFVQLYTAAVRGLAIDALRESTRPGAEASIKLLKDMQIAFIDQLLLEQDPD